MGQSIGKGAMKVRSKRLSQKSSAVGIAKERGLAVVMELPLKFDNPPRTKWAGLGEVRSSRESELLLPRLKTVSIAGNTSVCSVDSAVALALVEAECCTFLHSAQLVFLTRELLLQLSRASIECSNNVLTDFDFPVFCTPARP